MGIFIAERREKMNKLAFVSVCLVAASAKVYFKETFDNLDNWTPSENEKFDGKLVLDSGEWYGDKAKDQGLKTSQDAHFYGSSAPFSETFDNKDKTLVVQFSVK